MYVYVGEDFYLGILDMHYNNFVQLLNITRIELHAKSKQIRNPKPIPHFFPLGDYRYPVGMGRGYYTIKVRCVQPGMAATVFGIDPSPEGSYATVFDRTGGVTTSADYAVVRFNRIPSN